MKQQYEKLTTQQKIKHTKSRHWPMIVRVSIKQLLKVIFNVEECSIFRGLRHRAVLTCCSSFLRQSSAPTTPRRFPLDRRSPFSVQLEPSFGPHVSRPSSWSKPLKWPIWPTSEARGWSSYNAPIHLRVSTNEPFIPKIAKWVLAVVAAVLNPRQETSEQPR